MKKLALFLAIGIGLSACASDDNTPTATQSTSQTQYESADVENAKEYPHSGACRLLRENTAKKGRKLIYRCNGAQILNTAEARDVLQGMPVSFGSGSGNAKGYRTTRQAAKRFRTGDEKSCERAFINVLAKMRSTALKEGHSRISDLHSYYDRKPQSGGTYDCEVGSFHGRVVFRGRLH